MKTRFAKVISLFIITLLLLSLAGTLPALAAGATWFVSPAYDNSGCNATYRHCKTIQAAVDAASDGDVIRILPGFYAGTINIVSRSNISLVGSGANLTTLQPTSTLNWDVGGYGSSRKAAIRIVYSTNISFHGITLDMDIVKGNNVIGIFAWNSSGELKNSTIKNNQLPDSSGGYYEIGMYIRASEAPYDDSNRASYNITDSIFQNVGRVGIVMHNWLDVTLQGNTFFKSAGSADFGYGLELGSTAKGTINNNIFHGFDTAALSDGSASGGIYIENSFTGSDSGVTKSVTVSNNEVYDSQYGMYIGNDWAGYAGDVDIVVTMNNNKIHDNQYAGVFIVDEGASAGSSVSVSGSNNRIYDNEIGYEVYTYGDGEVHVSLSGETITGNTGVSGDGVYVGYDPSIGTSIYDVSLIGSNISGNSQYGVEAMSGITVTATGNWWGSNAGPGASGNNGTNGNVLTTPWAYSLIAGNATSTHEVGESTSLETNVNVSGMYGAQLYLLHDSSILNWVNGSANNVPSATPPWAWDWIVENFVTMSGGKRLSGTMTENLHTVGADLNGESIATWNYTCAAPGISSLTYDLTSGTGTYLADKEGFAIASAITGDSVTCLAETASVDGYIKLQGRLGTNPSPAGWNDAIVTLTCVDTTGGCSGYGPYTMVTDATGYYQHAKSGSGTGVALGNYSATVIRRAYLGATKTTNVTIVSGSNTINDLASAPLLLGGDANMNGVMDVGDLSVIGGGFGTTITPDTGADINGDGYINIFDLVLAGGNYLKTSSTWSP